MQTAKLNTVPGCPRVEVLALDYDKAVIRSDEAEPGHALLIVPVGDLSSFEGERDKPMGHDPKTETVNASALLHSDLVVVAVYPDSGRLIFGEVSRISTSGGYTSIRTAGGTSFRLPRLFPVQRVKV